jgi:hypothetical protein
MLKNVKKILTGLVMLLGLALLAMPTLVAADYSLNKSFNDLEDKGNMTSRPLFVCEDPSIPCEPIIPGIVSIMMYVVGIISVIMLIVGGILYAVSTGDEKKVTKAKGTIVAALIGLAFAILAWTLVNFVFSAIK